MAKVKSSKSEWVTTSNRFVAFLDILGFKDLVARNSHDNIYELLQKLSKTKENVQKAPGFMPIIKEQLGDVEVHVVNFSDSISIFSKDDKPESFIYFLLATRWIFTCAITNGIPIKGGIAHGIISINKVDQIYYGQPLIDAYLMEEEVNYYGIVAHNSIDMYVSKMEDKSRIDRLLFEIETPLKCGNIVHTNINWFRIMKYDTLEELKKKIESYRTTSSGTPRKYIDNTLRVIEQIKDTISN